MMSNIIIGCDQSYFDNWAKNLLYTVNKHCPFIKLHCHIVNPTRNNNLPYVDITSENINFSNDIAKISYLQSVRFIVAYEKFNKTDKVFSLDCDTICTRPIFKNNLNELFKQQYVLQHMKDKRWLAGFVTLANYEFRLELYKRLTSVEINDREWGRDQIILDTLKDEFKFKPLPLEWMSIGKNKNNSVFLTLKGEQKTTDKYLSWYKRYMI